MRSWSPWTPVGTLARGGGGAHRPLPAGSAGSQSLQVGVWPRARTSAHSSSGPWDSSREGTEPWGFPGKSPRNSEDFRTLPTHPYWVEGGIQRGQGD